MLGIGVTSAIITPMLIPKAPLSEGDPMAFSEDDWDAILTPLRNNYPGGDIYVSLHNSIPSKGGNEIEYTGYKRAVLKRDQIYWDVKGDEEHFWVTNAKDIEFGQCSGGNVKATHFGIIMDDGLIYEGELSRPLSIGLGITPTFLVGALCIEEDNLS